MNIEIRVQTCTAANLESLAQLSWESRKVSPLWNEDQTPARFKDYLEGGVNRWPGTLLITALRGEKPIGWLGLITGDPLTYELWRWHPFLLPEEDQDAIAAALLSQTLEIAREKGAQSLKVCCHFQKDQLIPEVERYYQKYHTWYRSAGLHKADESVYLTCPAGQLKLVSPTPISAPFSIVDYHPQYLNAMYACCLDSFSVGQDRTFQNRTEEQKKALFYDYLETNLNPRASKVLLVGEQVIGFTLVQTRQRVGDEHLALIAVAPEYQGQGWGRRLISTSIQSANLGEEEIFSIGVDLCNQIAYRLYSSLGFEIQTQLINHVWKNNQ